MMACSRAFAVAAASEVVVVRLASRVTLLKNAAGNPKGILLYL
jgi:hypothetical protein